MIAPAELVRSLGGTFATALGIDLRSMDCGERFKWLIAAIHCGTRISEQLATRAWREFGARGILAPRRLIDTGWDGLVPIFDAGGYVRYDFKTATKLLAVCTALLRDYSGDLDDLHSFAADPLDLEARLKALGKGIGDTAVGIFLRELRGISSKAAPSLSPLAQTAAQSMGYLRHGRLAAAHAPERLQQIWVADGQSPVTFAAFEAALVREGLRLRREEFRHGSSGRETI
ncbi:MAG TPA: hypothetical protein VMJ33_11675 [Gallionella sp.]|nr:hypothetical protein [Gallionella sp.]